LTKGDNNSVDDRVLYAPDQQWLERSDIVGRARGYLPYVGMVTILMNEYPNVRVCIGFYFIKMNSKFSDFLSILLNNA